VPFLVCLGADADVEPLASALAPYGVTVSAAPLPDLPAAESPTVLLGLTETSGRANGVALRWAEFRPYVVRTSSRAPSGDGKGHDPGRVIGRGGARPAWQSSLDQELPGLRYLHLVRRNKQAMSPTGDGPPDLTAPLRVEDWLWIGYFTWSRTDQLTVAVEDLVAEPGAVAARVVGWLGLADARAQPDGRARELSLVRAPTSAAPDPDPRPRSRHPARAPAVSIVVVSHNEGENLPLTVGGLRATVPDEVEIVVVDDWSTDGSVAALRDVPADVRVIRPAVRGGVTGARNAGAAAAQGDVLVFADAHVDPAAGWLEALCAALADPGVACAAPGIAQIHERHARGYGFTWREPQLRMRWLRRKGPGPGPYEVPFICGCLMAFRRADFESVGGFDPGLVRWGVEDAEIGLNLWRRDRASVVVPDATVAHLFRPAGPYEVPQHLIVHNTLRLAAVHLPEPALARVIATFQSLQGFPVAYTELLEGDAWVRRDQIERAARHDGAWFLDRFRIRALQ
jgi:GT2 family glycosyltransferase